MTFSPQEEKMQAARRAVEEIEDGMVVGLGTGSTANIFIELLAKRLAHGIHIRTVPTSHATEALARHHGLVLAPHAATVDIMVDGVDEIDSSLHAIKGGGGALVREKIVAATARHMVVIADSSKKVARLGKFPLAVAVLPFAHAMTAAKLAEALAQNAEAMKKDALPPPPASGKIQLRKNQDGTPFTDDNGNYIYDLDFGAIAQLPRLSAHLSAIPGVVDHGLFVGFIAKAFIGVGDGWECLVA